MLTVDAFIKRIHRRTENGRFNWKVTQEGRIRTSGNHNPIIALAHEVGANGNTPDAWAVNVATNHLNMTTADAISVAQAVNNISPANKQVSRLRRRILSACGLNN